MQGEILCWRINSIAPLCSEADFVIELITKIGQTKRWGWRALGCDLLELEPKF